ncbi:MAG: helix-turn-helix domain-containing protein [Cyanobacteria bacterium P01_C01_bin.120]
MSGVYQLEITKSEADLKRLLRPQKTATDKDRVHLLYRLKSGRVETMQEAAVWLGRHRVTVQKWAKRYRERGISKLLNHQARSGAKSTLPQWAETALRERLEPPEGFRKLRGHPRVVGDATGN